MLNQLLKNAIFPVLSDIDNLQYAITSTGRIVIGLYGKVVPKTVGMSLFFYFMFFCLQLNCFKNIIFHFA